MMYAVSHIGERLQPSKGLQALCPSCGEEVISKCGDERVWHWAHKHQCSDAWYYEPMSEWHRKWQDLFPEEWQEVAIRKGEKLHRADVQTPSGLVIEFQNSPIKKVDIDAREAFYPKMLWVLNWKTLGSQRAIDSCYCKTGTKKKEIRFIKTVEFQLDNSMSQLAEWFHGGDDHYHTLHGIKEDMEDAGYICSWGERDDVIYFWIDKPAGKLLEPDLLAYEFNGLVKLYLMGSKSKINKVVWERDYEDIDDFGYEPHFIRYKAPIIFRRCTAPVIIDFGKYLFWARRDRNLQKIEKIEKEAFLKKYRDRHFEK